MAVGKIVLWLGSLWGTLALTGCASTANITVVNPSDVYRVDEMVEVPLSRLGRVADKIRPGVGLKDGRGQIVPTHITHDSLLIFPVSLKAHGKATFRIEPGLTHETVCPQTLRQFGGKGLPLRFAGIFAQQQAGRPGKAGQSQPDEGHKLQAAANQPGDPAPARREQFRQIAGQPVALDQQNQHRQHDACGHYLHKVLQHRQPPVARRKAGRHGM